MIDTLEASERAKYERMWDRPEYRVWSPGEDCAEDAMSIFGLSSVIDFGCGEGKALDKFLAAGIDAIGVDFVALHDSVMEACLWDLPRSLDRASWGFCADVMEHIPTEKVDDVIRSIAGKVRRGCYFRISTVPDGMGKLIGETLHLTVRPTTWWESAVLNHFESATATDQGSYCTIVAYR